MKVAIILGSSRTDGNTGTVVNSFIDKTGATLFDLKKYDITFFDYVHKNSDDDFPSLINQLISFDNWIFATPVY